MKPVFPYETLAGDINISRVEVKLDGAAPRVLVEDVRQSRVNVYAAEIAAWGQLTADVQVDGPASELRLFEKANGVTSAILVVESSRSLMRLSAPLSRDSSVPARWSGSVRLGRDDFFGDVVIRAVLTGTVDGVAHREVQRSPEWHLFFDEPAAPKVDGCLDVKWADFKNPKPGLEKLAPYADLPCKVDFTDSPPTLYLNSAIERLNLLLPKHATVQQKNEQAISERIAAEFAGQAWVAMFGAATAEAIENNAPPAGSVSVGPVGMPQWPTDDWMSYVLRTLLGLMEPYATMTPDHALSKLIDDWGTGRDAGALQAELQAAVATHLQSTKPLRKILKQLYEEGV